MRRELPTLILIIALLVGSGLVISSNFSVAALFRGYYIPTFSADPTTAQTEALIFIGSVAAILLLTIGMGIGLAFAFYRITKMLAVQPSSAKPETSSKSAPKSTLDAPKIPLMDTRSVAIFWVVLITLTGGFLALRFRGQALGYVPDLLATPIVPTRAASAVSAPTQAPSGGGSEAEALQAELTALPQGDPTAGKAVFTSAGCVACHSLDPEVKIVGPSQAGVATRAATRKPGYSAELYIYESVTKPGAYVLEGFQDGIMPPDFKTKLTPQQLADVISFLLTLK
jgi:nitric oxide reductase subunit C